jgi:hypothetical protein
MMAWLPLGRALVAGLHVVVLAWPAPPSDPAPSAALPAAPAGLASKPVVAAAVAPPVANPNSNSNSNFNACTQERVEDLARQLSIWSARFAEARRAAYAERGCERADVLCLDRFGETAGDALPDRVRAGQTFSLEVVVPGVDSGKVAISTSGGAKSAIAAGPFAAPPDTEPAERASAAACELAPSQRDSLKAAAAPIAELGKRPGLEALAVPAGAGDDAYWMASQNANIVSDWASWAAAHAAQTPRFTAVEAKVEVPFGEPSLEIDFARTESGSAAPSTSQHYAVWIDSGQYHLEASVLVPFVYRGRRRATLTPTPGGGAYEVGLDQDWHVTAAVMIDLFPFGRQKGQVSSFVHCRSGSCAENWLGIQFGTGLSSIFQEWYLGILFEPVSGLGIGAGASLLKGDFLGPGLAEGMLLPSPAQFSAKSDYMFRPYFGIAVTSDVFQTLDRSSVLARIW